MARFSKSAAERFDKIRDKPDVPDWLTTAGGLLFGVFIIFTGFSLAAGNEPRQSSGAAREGLVPITAPGPENPDSSTSSPAPDASGRATPTTAPAGTEPVAVPVETGGTAHVPGAAATVASDAAAALFTGATDGIPVSSPDVWTASTRYDNPTVTNQRLRVDAGSEGRYVFAYTVDPDGAGAPQPPREVTVAVALEDARWVFTGPA